MSISPGFIVISEIKPGKDELIVEGAPIRSAPSSRFQETLISRNFEQPFVSHAKDAWAGARASFALPYLIYL